MTQQVNNGNKCNLSSFEQKSQINEVDKTKLEELLKEHERYTEIVKIKKRHLKECKKVLNFYVKQVKRLEMEIENLGINKTHIVKRLSKHGQNPESET